MDPLQHCALLHRTRYTIIFLPHICCSFLQVVCLTTGPKPLPKRALHIVRSRASSFKWEYLLLSVRSSSSFLRLLFCLPVTSIHPFIFPSITRCRRQFRRKMTHFKTFFPYMGFDNKRSIYCTALYSWSSSAYEMTVLKSFWSVGIDHYWIVQWSYYWAVSRP
jgi:hypothetical protein